MPLFFILKSFYSIIIPVYNELNLIPDLLKYLMPYQKEGHEIIIVNDGSDDGSELILTNCSFIKVINLENNKGKNKV